MVALWQIRRGSRFSIPELRITGKLLDKSLGWATVRIDRPEEIVVIRTASGLIRRFRANRDEVKTVSAGTLVELERR